MDRREFVGAVGAGVLFPAEIAKVLAKPKVEACYGKEIPVYSIYYMRNGTDEVYRIWQPSGFVPGVGGLVLGAGRTVPERVGDHYSFSVSLRKTKGRGLYRLSSSGEWSVFSRAPAGSLVVASRNEYDGGGMMLPIYPKDDFGIPYLGSNKFWRHHTRGANPFIVSSSEVKRRVDDGQLYKMAPFCSMTEFLNREDSWFSTYVWVGVE